MYFTSFKSPIGPIFLYANENKLLELSFKKKKIESIYQPNLPLFLLTMKELEEYFNGKRRKFTIPLELHGTEFQIKVWQALQLIPYGTTISYSDEAKIIQLPKAQRAVGSANGKNPLPIIIPCHRVIAKSGKLGGFSSDIKIKQTLLKIEGCIL